MSVVRSPHVTVIVPVHNRMAPMMRCLESILEQDYPSFDVLVLDNCSTDGTYEACVERSKAVGRKRIAVHRTPGLVGRVRNAGVKLARGEILAFTDSDCLPQPGWLRAGAGAFADDEVGVVTGPTLPETELRRWAATQQITDQTWRFEACNVFFRREALVASEGFDETRTMWEDTAAGWSVLSRGWRAAFASDAIVHHDVTYPGWTWHLRRVLRYGEGVAVLARYPDCAERLLWHRHFLRPRNAKFAAAVLGAMLSPLDRRALVLTLPYLRFRWPPRVTPRAVLESVQLTVFDLAVMVGMIRGSLEAHRLVL